MIGASIITKNEQMKGVFYYVSKNKDDLSVRPSYARNWSKYFNDNCIVHSTQKRAYGKPSQHIQVVMPV